MSVQLRPVTKQVSGLFLPGSLLIAHCPWLFFKDAKGRRNPQSQRPSSAGEQKHWRSGIHPGLSRRRNEVCASPPGAQHGGLAKGWGNEERNSPLAAAGPARIPQGGRSALKNACRWSLKGCESSNSAEECNKERVFYHVASLALHSDLRQQGKVFIPRFPHDSAVCRVAPSC
jgi:hypothetical protein